MELDRTLASIPLLVRAANLIDESFMITTADLDSPGPQIVYVNQAFTEMTGYLASEVIGRSPRFLQGGTSQLGALRRLKKCLQSGGDFDGQLTNYRKGGESFVMELRIRAIRDDEGKATHYFAVQRDATRESEELAHNRRLRLALDQTLDEVVIFDATGRVRYVNAAYLAWSKCSADEVLGRRIWTLPGCPAAREDLAWARRRLTRGDSWQREYEIQLGNERRTVFTTISPVRSEGEEVSEFVVISRDVTERTRLVAIAKAHGQVDQLEQMFAVIRHELGNPVNSIKSALTILESDQDPLSSRQSGYVSRILDEVGRMEFLLASLRNFGQFERFHIERLELQEVVEKLHGAIERELTAAGVELVVRLPPTKLEVMADRSGLLHALRHLVQNAIEGVASTDDPEITFEAHAVEGRVFLSVIDNGEGIPKEDLGRVVGPFYTTRPKRAGLGLSIVNKLINRMRGTLSIDSHRQGGTAVTIDLGIADRPAQRATAGRDD